MKDFQIGVKLILLVLLILVVLLVLPVMKDKSIQHYQDTRSCVSGQERHKMHGVLFTEKAKLLISTPCISWSTLRISTKFTYFMFFIYMTLHNKFERNRVSGVQDIHFQKFPNFLHIFYSSSHHFWRIFETRKNNFSVAWFPSNLAHQ